MSETVFWETFWKFALPSLLLCAGLLIGVIAALVIPISDEDRRKAAKEIEGGASRFVEAFRPLNGLGSMAWRFAFFYIVGMFSVTVLGSILSNILKLPEIYDITMRIVASAAEYLPPIIFIPLMACLGQETGKTVRSLSYFIAKLVSKVKKMYNHIEEETER